MSVKLFEIAAIFVPTSDEDTPKIIVDVKPILAKDEKQAALIAARAVPTEYEDRLDEVELVVRPF